MEPYDCALRNILWEEATETLYVLKTSAWRRGHFREHLFNQLQPRRSLVDFEHYHPMTKDPINMDLNNEMMRWGIVRRPPHTSHWKAFFEMEGLYN